MKRVDTGLGLKRANLRKSMNMGELDWRHGENNMRTGKGRPAGRVVDLEVM